LPGIDNLIIFVIWICRTIPYILLYSIFNNFSTLFPLIYINMSPKT